jgi:cell division ATPase FtsA
MLIVVDIGSHRFRVGAFENGEIIHTDELESKGWNAEKPGAFDNVQKNLHYLIQAMQSRIGRSATKVIIVLSDQSLKCVPIVHQCTIPDNEASEKDLNRVSNEIRAHYQNQKYQVMHFTIVDQQTKATDIDSSVGSEAPLLTTMCNVIYQDYHCHAQWQNVVKSLPNPLSKCTDIYTGSQVAQDIIANQDSSRKECVAVVDIGQWTKLYIFNHDKHVALFNISVAADDFLANLSTKLGVSATEVQKLKEIVAKDQSESFAEIILQTGKGEVRLSKADLFAAMNENITIQCNKIKGEIPENGWKSQIERFIFIGGGASFINPVIASEALKCPAIVKSWKFNHKTYGPEWSNIFAIGLEESKQEDNNASSITGYIKQFCTFLTRPFSAKK